MMRVIGIASAAVLMMLLIGCDADPTIATIGTENVKLREFETTYAKSSGGWDSCANTSVQERQKFLDLMVNFKLKVLEAQNQGLLQDSAVQSELTAYRATVTQSYMIEKELVEPGLKQMLQRRKELVRASHIFFRLTPKMTPEDTAKLYERAQKAIAALATQPFDTVVAQMTEDPSTRLTGGEVGYFSAGRMVPEFEDAAYGLKAGEYTKVPVRTRYGYHVIKVLARMPNDGGVHISHILLRFADDHHDTATVRDSAFIVYNQIKGGMRFEDAAKKYSKDPRSTESGGDIGTYERERLPSVIVNKVFGVDSGSVTEPVWFNYGYHIFKVTGKQPLASDSVLLDGLKKTYQDVRYQYEHQNYVQKLKQKYPLRFDSVGVRNFAKALDSTKTTLVAGWNDTLTKEIRASVLVTCGSTKLTVDGFVEKVGMANDNQKTVLTATNIWNLVNKFSDELVVEEHAKTAEQRFPVLASLLKEYQEGVLLYRVEQDEVWKKIAVNDSVLKNYYNQHKEGYRWPERVNFSEIHVQTDSAANAAYWQLKYGEDFSEVAKRNTVRPGYSEKGGAWGFQLVTANDLSQRAAVMALDSVTPPFRYETGWSIIKVLGRDSAQVKTFEEAMAEVTTGYQDQASKQREEDWLTSLKAKYPVTLHKEILPEAFKGKKIEVQ